VNKREPKLSQTDYVNRGGGECPWCENTSIRWGGDYWTEGDIVHVDGECQNCGRAWIEDYKLTGYTEVKG